MDFNPTQKWVADTKKKNTSEIEDICDLIIHAIIMLNSSATFL